MQFEKQDTSDFCCNYLKSVKAISFEALNSYLLRLGNNSDS